MSTVDRSNGLPGRRRRRSLAGDLGIDAEVVQWAGDDGDDRGAGRRAAVSRVAEVAALAGRDEPDDEPDHDEDCAGSHGCLLALTDEGVLTRRSPALSMV